MLGIPTIARGIVYEGTTLGNVVALDERTGLTRWRAALGANPDETYGNPRGVISSVAVRANVAYAVSGSCEAAAFDTARGTVLWRRRVCSVAKSDDTYASPALGKGRVLLGIDVIADRPTDFGRELALDAATGASVWSFSPLRYRGTGGGISATAAVDSARALALVGTGNPTPMRAPRAGSDRYTDSVIAADLRTGRWHWARQLLAHDTNDFDLFASPQLYSITRNGRRVGAVGVTLKNSLYAMLDEATGRVLWQRQLEPPMRWMQSIGTPAASEGIIVIPLFHGPSAGELIALRANDGGIVWRRQTAGIYEAPVVWRHYVLAAQARGAVASYDLRTGTVDARIALPSELYGHGLAIDGDLLFVAGRGKFWAYRLEQ